MGVVVGANYAAQVVYTRTSTAFHLSPMGGLLLGATLAWFVGGVILAAHRRSVGYWVLLSYFQ